MACSPMRPHSAFIARLSDVELPTVVGGGGRCLWRWQALEPGVTIAREWADPIPTRRERIADVDVSPHMSRACEVIMYLHPLLSCVPFVRYSPVFTSPGSALITINCLLVAPPSIFSAALRSPGSRITLRHRARSFEPEFRRSIHIRSQWPCQHTLSPRSADTRHAHRATRTTDSKPVLRQGMLSLH